MRKLSSKLAGQQSGFTLIELVIVIVIIGILAAVAIPNFTNLSDDAKLAKANANAGALASWAGANYARCSGKLSGAVAGTSCTTGNAGTAGLTEVTAASGSDAACTVTVGGVTSSPALVVPTAPSPCN